MPFDLIIRRTFVQLAIAGCGGVAAHHALFMGDFISTCLGLLLILAAAILGYVGALSMLRFPNTPRGAEKVRAVYPAKGASLPIVFGGLVFVSSGSFAPIAEPAASVQDFNDDAGSDASAVEAAIIPDGNADADAFIYTPNQSPRTVLYSRKPSPEPTTDGFIELRQKRMKGEAGIMVTAVITANSEEKHEVSFFTAPTLEGPCQVTSDDCSTLRDNETCNMSVVPTHAVDGGPLDKVKCKLSVEYADMGRILARATLTLNLVFGEEGH
jgi:hypothetical protein